jgi:polyhydroxybutyrate depolymerase
VTGWDAKADAESFIVVFPNGTDTEGKTYPVVQKLFWNGYDFAGTGIDDLGFLVDVLARLKAHYRIDPKRIYACGFSMGARMTNTLGIVHSDKVAAIGPVSGSWVSAIRGPAVEESLYPKHPLPVWIWRGSEEVFETGDFPEPRDVQDQKQKTWWINRNQTGTVPAIEKDAAKTTEKYVGGWRGVAVYFTEVAGTGHQWQPGATGALWDFFKKYEVVEGAADPIPPKLILSSVVLKGALEGEPPFTVTVGGEAAEVFGTFWTKTLLLPATAHSFLIKATDGAGRISEKTAVFSK